MSFDHLVNDADNNGGNASMIVKPEFFPSPQTNYPQSLENSSPIFSAPNTATFSQPHPLKNYFQGAIPTDPLYEVERANRLYTATKEYKRNVEEDGRRSRIAQKQWGLSMLQITPIEKIILEAIPGSMPHGIVTTTNCLSYVTGLQPLGIAYALLGAVSIATWGRVYIKLDDFWSEPAVDMIIQVSSAGTKKSSLTKNLRAPFDQFCAQRNENHEERSKNAKEETRLAAKAADRRSRKIIESALEEGSTMGQKDELAVLQRAIGTTAQFNRNLMQTMKIPHRVQLLVDKGTHFQLAVVLSEQGECQGCITAEGNMVLSKMIRSAEAANLFLRGHTQEPYLYENAKKQINLTHPALPMINLVQPVVASKLYGNELLNENGVTARFVPYFHHGAMLAPYGFNLGDGLTEYNSKITKLLHLYHTQDKNAQRYEVGVTNDALDLIKSFEAHIRCNEIPNTPKTAVPCVLKAHGQAVRFAWDIHAWNNEQPHLSPINAIEIQAGIDMVRASFTHIKYAYSPSGLVAYSVARKIIESLRHINDSWEQNKLIAEGIDSTTLQQRIGSKSKEVNNALRLLEEHNWLAVYDDATNNLKVALHPNFYRYPYL